MHTQNEKAKEGDRGAEPTSVLAVPPSTLQILQLSATSDERVLEVKLVERGGRGEGVLCCGWKF